MGGAPPPEPPERLSDMPTLEYAARRNIRIQGRDYMAGEHITDPSIPPYVIQRLQSSRKVVVRIVDPDAPPAPPFSPRTAAEVVAAATTPEISEVALAAAQAASEATTEAPETVKLDEALADATLDPLAGGPDVTSWRMAFQRHKETSPGTTFRQFLIPICRRNGLGVAGAVSELVARLEAAGVAVPE
jgi:hypothetical protein